MREQYKFRDFLNPDMEINPLGSGRRAHASLIGEGYVMKEVHGEHESVLNIDTTVEKLQRQYNLLKMYLDPYVLDTNFVQGLNESDNPSIFIIQKRIEGLNFEEAVERGLVESRNMCLIEHFLRLTLQMRKETGFIPDLYNSQMQIKDWFNPLKTRNVLVDPETYRPVLIDTNFTLRSGRIDVQLIQNPLLSFHISRLLRRIEG